MNLLGILINHHTAPVEVRETFHLSNEEIINFYQIAKGSLFNEGVIISTCNRTEIYFIPLNKDVTFESVLSKVTTHKNIAEYNHNHFQFLYAKEAMEHLFSVITGIDSLMIGDNQIFTQVKDSFILSEEAGMSGSLFKRLFDAAIRSGKRSITETSICEGAVTVSFAAVQLIEKIFSNLNKKSALVIGAGETSEIAAKHLVERGIGNLTITNRTLEKAQKVADSLRASVLPFESFKDKLSSFDIILSATSAPGLILTKKDIALLMKQRDYSPLVLMDIAIPRDIDPDSKDLDYVFYHDIDSLNIIVNQNRKKRESEIPKVKAIIDEEVTNYFNWFNSLEVAPVIKEIRDMFEKIRAEEFDKNKNKFNQADQDKIEILTRKIINKLLHHPTTEIRKMSENQISSEEIANTVSIVKNLFGINKDNQQNN